MAIFNSKLLVYQRVLLDAFPSIVSVWSSQSMIHCQGNSRCHSVPGCLFNIKRDWSTHGRGFLSKTKSWSPLSCFCRFSDDNRVGLLWFLWVAIERPVNKKTISNHDSYVYWDILIYRLNIMIYNDIIYTSYTYINMCMYIINAYEWEIVHYMRVNCLLKSILLILFHLPWRIISRWGHNEWSFSGGRGVNLLNMLEKIGISMGSVTDNYP